MWASKKCFLWNFETHYLWISILVKWLSKCFLLEFVFISSVGFTCRDVGEASYLPSLNFTRITYRRNPTFSPNIQNQRNGVFRMFYKHNFTIRKTHKAEIERKLFDFLSLKLFSQKFQKPTFWLSFKKPNFSSLRNFVCVVLESTRITQWTKILESN